MPPRSRKPVVIVKPGEETDWDEAIERLIDAMLESVPPERRPFPTRAELAAAKAAAAEVTAASAGEAAAETTAGEAPGEPVAGPVAEPVAGPVVPPA